MERERWDAYHYTCIRKDIQSSCPYEQPNVSHCSHTVNQAFSIQLVNTGILYSFLQEQKLKEKLKFREFPMLTGILGIH